MKKVTELMIDPEFQSQIPPLTDEEFEQLRDNILSDGEVYEPIVTWGGTIIDGHNRWRIIREHWEMLKDRYHVKEMAFPDKWTAFDWMYRKQLGRRNLTEERKTYMIGKMYEVRKKTEAFKGNQYTKSGGTQNGHHQKTRRKKGKTASIIGEELGIGANTVRRAEEYARGVDTLKGVSTDAAEILLKGESAITKEKVRRIPRMEPKDIEVLAGAIVTGGPVPRQGLNQEHKPRGWTKEDRAERAKLEAIAADMYDQSTVPAYTVESLVDDIQLCAGEFVRQIKNTLKDRSTVLVGENKTIIADAIDQYIIKEIKKVRDLLK